MNENTWEVAVLKILRDFGESAELQEIYRGIKNSEYVTITPGLEGITYGQPNYYHTTRSILTVLMQKKHVERINRGIYSITSKGLERLEKIGEIEEI